MDDPLVTVEWDAGSINVHGSREHAIKVALEFIAQPGANRVRVRPATPEVEHAVGQSDGEVQPGTVAQRRAERTAGEKPQAGGRDHAQRKT